MAAASVDAPAWEEAEENKFKVITEVYRPLLIEVLDVKDIVEALKIQFGRDDGKIMFYIFYINQLLSILAYFLKYV